LITPYCYSIDERGGLTGVFQGLKWEEINCVESIAGSVRGKHYHEATTEGFFIINGKIRVTLLDVLTGSRRVFIVQKGNIMLIKPNTVHTFEMLENSRWINMLSKPLNNKIKDIHGIAQN
jgi:dTDP-4-dehydrorhamnose 3,5-epimerase-like enzyme